MSSARPRPIWSTYCRDLLHDTVNRLPTTSFTPSLPATKSPYRTSFPMDSESNATASRPSGPLPSAHFPMAVKMARTSAGTLFVFVASIAWNPWLYNSTTPSRDSPAPRCRCEMYVFAVANISSLEFARSWSSSALVLSASLELMPSFWTLRIKVPYSLFSLWSFS